MTIFAYFKDSEIMKEKTISMDLPPVTMLPTEDATSMYTNIQTRPALNQISKYFNERKKTTSPS